MTQIQIVSKNIPELKTASQKTGNNITDLQLLLKARELNEYLGIDSEILLFALFKEGIKPTIRELITLPEATLRSKIDSATTKKIIPEFVDMEMQIILFQRRMMTFLESKFQDYFEGIGDNELKALFSDSQKKGKVLQQVIIYTYQRKKFDTQFYNNLKTTPGGLTDDEIVKIKRFFDYSELCFGNVSFINQFLESNSLKHIDNLLELSKDEIKSKILGPAIFDKKTPLRISNNKKEDAKEKYASQIFNEIQNRYPTRALFLRLAKADANQISIANSSGDPIPFNTFKTLLVDHSNDALTNQHLLNIGEQPFNIRKDIIRDYFSNFGENHPYRAFVNNQQEGFKLDDYLAIFTAIQRLYYLASGDKFKTIYQLLKKNYYSAFDVVKGGKKKLTDDLAEALPQKEINYIYNAAEVKVNRVLALINKYNQSSNALTIGSIRNKQIVGNNTSTISVLRMPELTSLLGDQDVTDTVHAESVLGPAAYLVDLLDLTKQIEINDSPDKKSTLYDKLDDRRPDIALIKLNCKNALTVIPYIDLVNEVLEDFIAFPNGASQTNGRNTTKEAEYIEVNPEYCNYDVYNTIRNHFNWQQPPFNIWNEEIRAYTQALNIDRAQWFALQNDPQKAAFETLSLSYEDYQLFDVGLEDIITGVDGLINEIEGSAFGFRIQIKSLLDFTGLNLDEFNRLLDSFFVNPSIQHETTNDAGEVVVSNVRQEVHFKQKVDLSNAYLEFFLEKQAQTFVYSMYQFRRLQQITGWSTPLLDNILINIHKDVRSEYTTAPSGGNITIPEEFEHLILNEHLQELAKAYKIQQTYVLSENELMLLFGNLDIFEYKHEQSYLHWLFIDNYESQQNKDILISILNKGRTPAIYNTKMFTDEENLHPFMEYICRIIGLDAEDIQQYNFLFDKSGDEPLINEPNIIKLIRLWQLKSIIKIPVSELRAYIKLNISAEEKENNFDLISIGAIEHAINDIRLFKKHNMLFENLLYIAKKETISAEFNPEPNEDAVYNTSIRVADIIASQNMSKLKSNDYNKLFTDVSAEIGKLLESDEDVVKAIAKNYAPDNNDIKACFSLEKPFIKNLFDIVNAATLSASQIDIITTFLQESVQNTKPELIVELDAKMVSEIGDILKGNVDISDTTTTATNIKEQFFAISNFDFLNDLDLLDENEKQSIKKYLSGFSFVKDDNIYRPLTTILQEKTKIEAETAKQILDNHFDVLENIKGDANFTSEIEGIVWEQLASNLYHRESSTAKTKDFFIQEWTDLIHKKIAEGETLTVSTEDTELKGIADGYSKHDFVSGITLSDPEKQKTAKEFFRKNLISTTGLIRKNTPKEIADKLQASKVERKIALEAAHAFLSSKDQYEKYIETLTEPAKETVENFFKNNTEIIELGKQKLAIELKTQLSLVTDDADDTAKSIVSKVIENFDNFVIQVPTDQKDSVKSLFDEKPVVQNDLTKKSDRITTENLAAKFSRVKYNETLVALAELVFNESESVLSDLKNQSRINIIESIIKDLTPAVQAANFTGLTAEWAEDLIENPELFNIFSTTGNATIKELRTLMHLYNVKPHLDNPLKPFTFYKFLIENAHNKSIDIYRHFKWFPSFNLSMENIGDPISAGDINNRIQWFATLGTLHKMGIDLTCAPEWLSWEFSDASNSKLIVEKLQAIAMEKLGFETYKARMKPLRDKIRIKQRNALVNYILGTYSTGENGPKDATDLFSFFLLDTEMTPEVKTSRIVQAQLAIQLLVQRIQLNLEPEVKLDKSDENKWKWMSLYRVWEANRKIFLYPENWLEPELRDDKSIFFKELEEELKNNDTTPETIEQAYHNYFKKLENVSDLEYCQMYNETIGQYSVLHVIGRTKQKPHEYFYRKLVNESYWSAWEPLGLEINTEHIAPAVINNRLFVFWMEMHKDVKEPNIPTINPDAEQFTGTKPIEQWKAFICWSEYLNGTWGAKKLHEAEYILERKLVLNNNEVYKGAFADKKEFSFLINGSTINIVHHNWKGAQDRVYLYRINVYNNVLISPIGFWAQGFFPDSEFENHYQKHKAEKAYALTFPVRTESGTIAKKELNKINNAPSDVFITYPAQYLNLQSTTPFVAEFKQINKSFLYIPELQPVKPSDTEQYLDIVVQDLSDEGTSIVTEGQTDEVDVYTDEHADTTVFVDENGNPIVYENAYSTGEMDFEEGSKCKLSVHLGYHPFVYHMRRNIEKYGIEGLLDPAEFDIAQNEKPTAFLFPNQTNSKAISELTFNEDLFINLSKPEDSEERVLLEKFDFSPKAPYSIYNWEVFYHIPFMMANQFYTEGDFDRALKWIHYIFDPRVATNAVENMDEHMTRFWKFKPFAEHNEKSGIDDILFDTNMEESAGVESNELDKELEIWSNDPFKPHNVARLRVSAYMKATIMRYLDIVVARGDQSFRLDTMESVNEALQYYIIAAQLLGHKPEVLQTSINEPKTYTDFGSGVMGNAIETLEEAVIKPENAAYMERYIESNELTIGSSSNIKDAKAKDMLNNLYSKLQATEKVYKLYFGIPKNNKMFSYWDLVGDRLFKIRNSMNIDGVKRTLSLFAPPIDPGMLASAAAAGLNISDVVNGGGAPASEYRFKVLLGQAMDICNMVKSLGSQLLAAYEKGDSEKIAVLRANHEIVLSEKISQIKEKAIEDAEVQLQQLDAQSDLIEFRRNFYESRDRRNKKENQQLNALQKSKDYKLAIQIIQASNALAASIPTSEIGMAGAFGSPYATVLIGGVVLSSLITNAVSVLDILSSIESYNSNRAGILAGHIRRDEEWDFQMHMAEQEQLPLEKQKLSAEIRKAMAEKELENHKVQIANSKEAYQVLSTKYTNEALYNWMRKEISQLQRYAYDMAYKMAKQAEKAYNFELNPGGFSQFVKPIHFDRNYDGLLAGEKLHLELKEMEVAYHDNNKRKYELTKQVSLAMLDANQILSLRETGTCEIIIPEILFDMDHPGHGNRRIKSVSVTIPCVTGPYTTVSAELSLLRSEFKVNPLDEAPIESKAAITKMATSTAQNDSGMFQLNFNDERYLPFEGAGIQSHWALALPNNVRQFDYNTINDVVLTINYTAENTGNRPAVEAKLKEAIKATIEGNNGQFALFIDLKAQFPEVYQNLEGGNDQTITISNDMLPVFLRGNNFEVSISSVISTDNQLTINPTGSGMNIEPITGYTLPESDNIYLIAKLSVL